MNILVRLIEGDSFQFEVKDPVCIIGRSSKCQVILPFDGVSRQHVKIENENGEFFVTDLMSTNGVFLDGVKLEPGKKTPYQTFLTLSFGSIQSLQVELESTSTKVTKLPLRVQVPEEERPKAEKVSARGMPPKKMGMSKKERMQSMALNVVALLILGLAILWYLEKPEPVEKPPVQKTEKGAKKRRVKTPTDNAQDYF